MQDSSDDVVMTMVTTPEDLIPSIKQLDEATVNKIGNSLTHSLISCI